MYLYVFICIFLYILYVLYVFLYIQGVPKRSRQTLTIDDRAEPVDQELVWHKQDS